MLPIVRSSIAIALSLLLVACSNSDNAEEQDAISLLPILSVEELSAMYDEGRFEDVANSVKRKERDGLAERADRILAARAYVAQQDAIGADVALERISIDQRDQSDYVILAARVKLLEGEFERAVDILKDHSFEGEAFYEAKLVAGDALFLLKEPEDAIKEFTDAIEVSPDFLPAYISRAQMYLAVEKPQEALSDALKAVSIEGNNTIAQYSLGNAYRRLGKDAEAKQAYLASIEAFPENVSALVELTSIAIFENEIGPAKEYLDRIFSAEPENNSARFYDAMIEVVEGKDESAKDRLLLLASSSPSNIQINRLLGHVAYRLNELDTALERLELVYRVAPFDRITRIALADIYTRAGRSLRALEVLEPMIQEGSTDFVALSIASSAAAQKDDLEKAIEYTKRSVELAQNPEQTRNKEIVAKNIDGSQIKVMNRKLATFYFEANEPEKAYELLEEMQQSDENDHTSTTLLLNLQVRDGEYEKALKNANSLIEKQPESAIGFNARGTVNYHSGNYADAIKDYDKAIEMNSGYISALKNRAAAHLALENYQNTIEDLAAVLEANPTDAHAIIMTARAHLELGNAPTANRMYSTLEQVFEESPSYQIQHARAKAAMGNHRDAITKLRLAALYIDDNNTEIVEYKDGLMQEYQAAIAAEEAKTATVDKKLDAEQAAKEAELRALEQQLREQNAKLSAEEAANAAKNKAENADDEAAAKRKAEADRIADEAEAKRQAELRALEEKLKKENAEKSAEEKAEAEKKEDDTGEDDTK